MWMILSGEEGSKDPLIQMCDKGKTAGDKL